LANPTLTVLGLNRAEPAVAAGLRAGRIRSLPAQWNHSSPPTAARPAERGRPAHRGPWKRPPSRGSVVRVADTRLPYSPRSTAPFVQ